jgi:hypothetical protein
MLCSLPWRNKGTCNNFCEALLICPCFLLFAAAVISAVCGRKWKRRALGMSAPAEQLQFVWHAARYIAMSSKFATAASPSAEDAADHAAALADELEKLNTLRSTILEELLEEQVRTLYFHNANWCTDTVWHSLCQSQQVLHGQVAQL